MSQTIRADVSIEKGLELAYAAHAAHEEGGRYSPLFELYAQEAGRLIGPQSDIIVEDLRTAEPFPRLADLEPKQRLPFLGSIQMILLAQLEQARPEVDLLDAVTAHPQVAERRDAVEAYMFGRGAIFHKDRDGNVSAVRRQKALVRQHELAA